MTPTSRQHLTTLGLISRVLDCDDRTRRARSLLLATSVGAALVLAAAAAILAIARGAIGVSGAAGAVTVAGLAIRRGLKARHRSEKKTSSSLGTSARAETTVGRHGRRGRSAAPS
jgi:hypothetical protein